MTARERKRVKRVIDRLRGLQKRSRLFIECGCCGAWHRDDFYGDCRDNAERFHEPPADALDYLTLEDQLESESV